MKFPWLKSNIIEGRIRDQLYTCILFHEFKQELIYFTITTKKGLRVVVLVRKCVLKQLEKVCTNVIFVTYYPKSMYKGIVVSY